MLENAHRHSQSRDEKRLICITINPQKALAGISLKIDGDTWHILWEN